MFGTLNPFVILMGSLAFAGLLALCHSQWSADARMRRRCRKNHRRVVSRSKGPTIKLAVATRA
jgi:hypothetical protein